MENENVKNNAAENDIATVPYIVYEAEQARAERRDRRHIIALLIAIAVIFVGNLAWLYAWSQYDYSSEETTVSVDGGGDGNANYIGNNTNYVGNDGDINGKSEGENQIQKENP